MAQENAIESLYRHSIEAASQFVEDQMPSMLRLAQHELMPPPLPRAEAERDQIRPSWLMLLTGLVLLAGSDLAFADAAADANAAYRRGDYAAAIELYRSLAEQGDTAAQYVLGNMYDNGEGALRNKNEARGGGGGGGGGRSPTKQPLLNRPSRLPRKELQSRLQPPIRRMQARQRPPVVPRRGRGLSCRCSVKKACSSYRPR